MSSDFYTNFTVKIGCTPLTSLSGADYNTFNNLTQVYFNPTQYTTTGWNNYNFTNGYNWDGNSSIIVEVCWGKLYGNYNSASAPEQTYVTGTSYPSIHYSTSYYDAATAYISPSNGCVINAGNGTVALGSLRPNTRFNVCGSNSYTVSWSPSTYLDDPTKANPLATGIKTNVDYVLTATSTVNPNCKNTDTVHIAVDNSNSIIASPEQLVLCRPNYVQLNSAPQGQPPLLNLPCGTSNSTCPNPDSVFAQTPGANPNNSLDYASTPFYYYSARTQFLFHNDELKSQGLKSDLCKVSPSTCLMHQQVLTHRSRCLYVASILTLLISQASSVD